MIVRIKILAVVGLFLFGAVVVSAVSKIDDYLTKVVVTKSGSRSYNISFNEVERQMTELARSSEIEGQWVYVNEDQMLHDVSQGNTGYSVRINFLRFKSATNTGKIDIQGKSIVDVHIHPWKSYGRLAFLPVSTSDLHSHLSHNMSKFKELGASRVRAVVFDGYGVWEFTMSPQFEKEAGICVGENALLKKVDGFYNIADVKDGSAEGRAQVVERFITKCKTVGLYLTYKSLE